MEDRYYDNQQGKDEINITEVLLQLWGARKRIILAGVIGAIIGLAIAFSIPKKYTAVVSFAPETEQSIGSGVSSIATMMGVNLNNNVDAIGVSMFPDVIYSTPFVFELFSLPVTTVDGIETTFLDYLKYHQKKPWWEVVIGLPFKLLDWVLHGREDVNESKDMILDMKNLPRAERIIIKNFQKILIIEVNKKTGKTDISLTLQDPYVTSAVLESVTDNLKEYMIDYRTSKDKYVVERLLEIFNERREEYHEAQNRYAEFVDANKNLVLLSAQAEQLKLQQEMQLAYQVYSQVATQLEGARIKVQQAKPVFVILEPVSIPNIKSYPSKSIFLIVFGLLSAFFMTSWELFGKHYWNTFKKIKNT